MERAWAAVAYVPVPGWQVVPVVAAPGSRLVRFHAWQAAAWSLILWLPLAALAAVLAALDGAGEGPLGFLVGAWLLAGILGALLGAASAGRGRYRRLLPAAWLLGLLRR